MVAAPEAIPIADVTPGLSRADIQYPVTLFRAQSRYATGGRGRTCSQTFRSPPAAIFSAAEGIQMKHDYRFSKFGTPVPSRARLSDAQRRALRRLLADTAVAREVRDRLANRPPARERAGERTT